MPTTRHADALAARVLTAHYAFTCMGRTVEDKVLTRETLARKNIKKGNGRFIKTLMKEQTAPIIQIFSRARKEIRDLTFEGFGSSRIMAAAGYDNFMAVCREYDRDISAAVREFADEFPAHLRIEERKFGDSYKRQDYPADEQIEASFGFTFSAIPMARPSDTALDMLTGDAVAEISANYAQQLTAAVANIEQECMSRALAMLGDLAAELTKPRPTLYDSEKRRGIVPRLRDYIAILRQNNLSGNPTMARLAASIDEQLVLATDRLKDSTVLRQSTASEARTIIDTFAALGVRAIDVEAA